MAYPLHMSLSHIHWVAVVVSALVAIASGAIWFGPKTFYPAWAKAMRRPVEDVPGTGMNMGILFGSTFLAQFFQAFGLALVISMLKDPSGLKGAGIGLVVGIFIAAASSLGHRLFGGQGFKVWMIEVSNDVLNLVLMGIILGAWV